MARSSEWFLPFKFSDHNLYAFISSKRATCLTHPILLDLIDIIIFGETHDDVKSTKLTVGHKPWYPVFRPPY
jgi:hypothetical protein